MNIYVASSWRNQHHARVVERLRAEGHEVYDFKDADGFSWSEVDPNWPNWSAGEYLKGLDHPAAQRGFSRDMEALAKCQVVVYVTPCGVSASWEAGWAVGAGKYVFVYVQEIREPDLMVKMADGVSDSIDAICLAIHGLQLAGL